MLSMSGFQGIHGIDRLKNIARSIVTETLQIHNKLIFFVYLTEFCQGVNVYMSLLSLFRCLER